MKLIALDERKLESLIVLLDPVIADLQNKGASDEANKVLSLKKYIRASIEKAPEIPTASSMGQKGGRSRSHRKLNAAKKNAEKAGPPGHYYARLITKGSDAMPLEAIHYVFADRRSRDGWLTGPGIRQALFSVDPCIRLLQQQDPEALAAGDERLRLELARNRVFDRYERCHDTVDECEGCSDLAERRNMQIIASNSLCSDCLCARRPA